jgi:hypothetical protein
MTMMPDELGPKSTAECRIVTALMKIAAENDNKTSIFWLLGTRMRRSTRRGRATSIISENMSADPIILDIEHRQGSGKLTDELRYRNKIGNATLVLFANIYSLSNDPEEHDNEGDPCAINDVSEAAFRICDTCEGA